VKLPPAKVWLAAAALLLVLLAVGFWWNRQPGAMAQRLARYRAAGQPTTLAELDAWYAAVPDAENALVALLEADAAWRSTGNPNLITAPNGPRNPARGEAWPPALREAAQAELSSNAAPLAEIHAALQRPRSRFPGSFTAVINSTFLAHLSTVKQVARNLGLEARWAAETGDSERAANALLAELGVVRTLEKEPFIINYLVRIAVDAIAVENASQVLSRTALSEASLRRLQAALAAAEAPESLARAFIGERCLALDELGRPAGQMFSAFAAPAGPGTPSGNSLPLVPLMLGQFYDLSGLKRQDGDFYLDRLDELIAAAAGPRSVLPAKQDQLAAQVASLTTWRGRLRPLSRMSLPSLHGVLPKELRWVATLRCAQTAMALERWRLAHGGTLPASLNELAPQYLTAVPEDPLAGKSLRYRTLAPNPGYVVYSLGEDGTDDGGKERVFGAGKTNGWDYTFIVNR
jgi:hypothetical protein